MSANLVGGESDANTMLGWRDFVRAKLHEKHPAGLLGLDKWTCTICSVGTLHKPLLCFNPQDQTGCLELVCGGCISQMQFDAVMNDRELSCPFCRAKGKFCTYLRFPKWISKCDRKQNPQKYKSRNAIGRCFCTKCRTDRKVTKRRFDLLKACPAISDWFEPVMTSARKNRLSVCSREWPRATLKKHFNGVLIKK